MSDLERRKATLRMVRTSGEHRPYGEGQEWSVQDYIESEYSVYLNSEKHFTDEECLSFLNEYYWDEFDKPSPYYLIRGKLFKMVEEKDIDVTYHTDAKWISRQEVEVDCTWYNGAAGFSEVVEEALKELEV